VKSKPQNKSALQFRIFYLVYIPFPGPPAEKEPPPPIRMFKTQKLIKSGCWCETLSNPIVKWANSGIGVGPRLTEERSFSRVRMPPVYCATDLDEARIQKTAKRQQRTKICDLITCQQQSLIFLMTHAKSVSHLRKTSEKWNIFLKNLRTNEREKFTWAASTSLSWSTPTAARTIRSGEWKVRKKFKIISLSKNLTNIILGVWLALRF